MLQTHLIEAVNESKATKGVKSLASWNKLSSLPVKPFTLTEACQAWASPENAGRVVSALPGDRFLGRARVLPVQHRGGGDLAEHIEHREGREERKQEECVEIASHFALQAFCANCTFLLVIAATFCTG